MSKHHAQEFITIEGFGTEIELEVNVSFVVHPGCKQTLTDPGEEPSAEVTSIIVKDSAGKVLDSSIVDLLTQGEEFHAWLMAEAEADALQAAEDAADAKRDELREDRV